MSCCRERELLPPRREKFLELAAVDPYTMTIRTNVESHGTIYGAINAQQIGTIPRAMPPPTVREVILRPAAKRGDLTGIIRKQLAQLLIVAPDSFAARALVHRRSFDRDRV
jgi:hypothetical protein